MIIDQHFTKMFNNPSSYVQKANCRLFKVIFSEVSNLNFNSMMSVRHFNATVAGSSVSENLLVFRFCGTCCGQ